MIFAPAPENDFRSFIDIYFEECTGRFPKIEAIAGKWDFEDLIPGMSDFDTRFICSDSMTADDWCRMSGEVGNVHLDLWRTYPHWSRILEHLPGVNLTWNELTDDFSYYPEYLQWTFYGNNDKKKYEKAARILEQHKWDDRDEYFHLKKFFMYYGPYNRSIDPAVNLGAYENKYPLHSRIMHYFDPPVQSAVSVILKKNISGKKEAFRLAGEIFAGTRPFFDELLEVVDSHYEADLFYTEPWLSVFENRLFDTMKLIFDTLKKHISIIPDSSKKTAEDIKKELGNVSIPSQLIIFDNCKFSRLMKGRLYFYANAPVHFDSVWTIQNELRRIGENFYRTPYRMFWELMKDEDIRDPDVIVEKLVPWLLTKKEAKATLEFSRLASGIWEEGKETKLALKIVDVFDEFFKGLYKITEEVKRIR